MSDPAEDPSRSEEPRSKEDSAQHPGKVNGTKPGSFPSHPIARPQHGGLVLKLTVAFAATFFALEAVLLINGHWYWREILQNQIQAHLTAVAASRSQMVEAGVKLLRQQATLNTQRGEFRRFLADSNAGPPTEIDRANSQKRFDRVVDDQSIFSASLVDPAGKIVLSHNPDEVGKSVAADPAFIHGLTDSYVGLPRATNGHLGVTIAAPLRNKGAVVGVLMMGVDAAPVAAPLKNVSGLGGSGEIMLIDREGALIRYVIPPRFRPDVSTVSMSAAPALASLLNHGGNFLQMADYRGKPVLAAANPTGYEGWSVVVKTDVAEAYAPIDLALRERILYGALTAAAGTLAVYFLARRFARPLRLLSEAAAQVAGGDYQSAVPVTSKDELGVLSASFNDMTAAIRARGSERDRAEAALRVANRRKDDFLAILGHELRNPVAAIDAGVVMWKEADSNPDATKCVQEVIQRQTGHLKRLVDDLLDVARITTGKVELRKSPVNVSEMIRHTIEAARPFIDERRHELEVSLTTNSSVWIDADAMRIEQVLTNLLINAAKYTPDSGRIAVTEQLDADAVLIEVRDNGVGLTAEVMVHIFNLFTQADSSLHRTSGGLGIGLSLSRRLVELHGGTLTAHSDGTGQGAAFTVRLPTIPAPANAAHPPAPPTAKGEGRRVLLVDDNRDTTRILSQLLERRGFQVCVAYDGREGLQAAQDFQPDALILDIGLPEIDGYELVRRFRAEGFADKLIVALSGYAQDGDRARSREAGFDHHFAKPVDLDALCTLILEATPAPLEQEAVKQPV
jgi:signal transduction histidine kinase/CheY-like chemotaxis protein